MAGLSSRFATAGYEVPKYMLRAGDRSLFEHAISGFRNYYDTETFLFIYLGGKVDPSFILEGCGKRGLARRNIALVELQSPTDGQASTVAQGLEHVGADGAEPITIFNIDSTYRLFEQPPFTRCGEIAGYLDVFKAAGNHWSFVLPSGSEKIQGPVAEVAEKRRISDLCSTGLYHFSKAELFTEAYQAAQIGPNKMLQTGERFVAPLYNQIIGRGGTIFYRLIDSSEIAFSGTPREYEEFLSMQPFNYV